MFEKVNPGHPDKMADRLAVVNDSHINIRNIRELDQCECLRVVNDSQINIRNIEYVGEFMGRLL